MQRFIPWRVAAAVVSASLLAGCCDEQEARIADLRRELAQAATQSQTMSQAASACEDLLDEERSKSAELERVIYDRLPFTAPASLEDEIIQLVPPEARAVAEEKILLYLEDIARRFDALQNTTEQVRREVVQVRRNVEVEGRETRLLQKSQMTVLEAQIAEQKESIERQLRLRAELGRELERLVEAVDTFDRESVSCKGCWKTLNHRAKKEEVLGFHTDLRRELRRLLDDGAIGEGP